MKLKELMAHIAAERSDTLSAESLEAFLDDFMPNTLMKSETLQKAFEISSFEMEELYREAYWYYQDDRLTDASTAFRWLVLLNPFIAKYWSGLAGSLQLLKKYEKALHAYAMVAVLDREDPYPHCYAYMCYKELENREEAIQALEKAYQCTLGKAPFQTLKKEIEQLMATLRRNHVCSHPTNPAHNPT